MQTMNRFKISNLFNKEGREMKIKIKWSSALILLYGLQEKIATGQRATNKSPHKEKRESSGVHTKYKTELETYPTL